MSIVDTKKHVPLCHTWLWITGVPDRVHLTTISCSKLASSFFSIISFSILTRNILPGPDKLIADRIMITDFVRTIRQATHGAHHFLL